MNRKAARNKRIVKSKASELDLPDTIDGVKMCHAQGKPAIYLLDSVDKVIRTEWPNGVVDDLTLATDQVVRTWPDGKQESFESNSKRDTIQGWSRD